MLIYKKSKYGNKKYEVDGIKFDSKREANRYRELKVFEKAKLIKDLKLLDVKYVDTAKFGHFGHSASKVKKEKKIILPSKKTYYSFL